MLRFRPSILFRYVFGEILSPTLLGLCVYMLVFLASFLFELVELAIRKDLPATTVLRLLLTILPRVLVLTVPMAVLLGVLVGIGRLSTDSEVIALRASGISYWRLLAPTLTVAAAGWAVCSYLMLDIEPRANLRRQQLTNEMMYAADVRREIKPRVFFEEVPGLLLYADEVHRGGDFLERVFIYQSEEGGRELVTLARRAQIEYDRRDGVARFYLEDGSTHSTTPADAQGYQVSRFERQMIRKGPDESFRIRNSLLNRPLAKNFGQQNLKELAASVIKAGSTITHEETRNKVIGHILAVMHERFALPVACLVFALLGLPLGIMNRRGGRASGFSLSIGIAILYWLLLSSGTNLVRQGRLSPYIGLWLGNAVLGLAGVVLFVLRERSEHLGVAFRLPAPARLLGAARAVVDRWRERWAGSRFRTASRRRGRRIEGPVALRAVGATAEGGSGDDDPDDEASPARRRSRRASAIAIGAVAIAAILVAINYLPLLLVGLTLLAILMVFRTTLDRYILKRFGTVLAGSLVTLFLLFTVYEFVNLLDDLVDRDLPFSMALTYFKYRTPWIIAQILPMSCLVATLMTFGLMSRFNEVTALKASGTSIYRLAVPVVLATVSLSAVAYVNGDYIVPFTSRRATQLKDEIRGRTPRSYGARERRWVFGEGGRLYNFQNYTPTPIPVLQASSGTFQGMSVYLFDPTGYAISERVYARRATYADGLWLLQDGWVRQFRAGEESFEIFAEKLFDFPEAASDFVREWRTPDQMNYGELRKFIVDLRRRGYDVQELLVDLHDKTAMPLVSFTMVLLGLPFCFRMGKRGSFYGLGVAVGLVAAFVLTFSTTNALGGTGLMPPFLAAWAPNILFSSTGIYLLLKTGT